MKTPPLLVALAILSLAPPAEGSANRAAEALETLRAGDRTPASRARAVEVLADPAAPLTPAEFADLLGPAAPWTAHIDAAELAGRRLDPALAPAMFSAFVESKASRVVHDPDVFERLLRGLQRFPPEVAASAFTDADLGSVSTNAADRLSFHWLNPLDVEFEGLRDPGGWIAAAVDLHTRRRVAQLATKGEYGLVTLQSDSGDAAFHVVEDAELIILVGQLLALGEEKLTFAEAVCRHRVLARDDARAAIAVLREVGRPFTAADERLLRRFVHSLPRVGRSIFVPERVNPVTGPVEAEPWTDSPLMPAGARVPSLPVGAAAYAILLFLGGGLLARKRSRRKWVFPLVAVGMTPLLFAGAELALGVAGVEPLGTVRPTFNPTNAPQDHFEEKALEGVPHHVTVTGRTRFAAVPKTKAEGELRVVTLGASSVHGSNYLAEEAWPAVVGRRLQANLPDKQVRVVNLGTGGAVSDEVFFYAREAIELLDPDLVIVSLGYNDFTHLKDLSAYRAYEPRDLQLRLELDRWRIVRVLSDVLPRLARTVEPTGAFLDPEGMSAADVAAVHRVAERSMQSNLERITGLARGAGVDVLFLMQAQNEELCGEGSARGSTADQCFPPAQRRAMARAAARDGVTVVDSVAALRAHAEGGPIGFRYFWDRIHASRTGHAVLGEALAPAATRILQAR